MMHQQKVNQVIAHNLQHIRLSRKLTYDQFAERLNISGAHLRKLEKGENTPNAQIIFEVCSGFNVSADKLLGIKYES